VSDVWNAYPDAVDKLKAYFVGGFSASQIANKLSLDFPHRGTVFTRNAIIGKIHRLDLKRGGGDRRSEGATQAKIAEWGRPRSAAAIKGPRAKPASKPKAAKPPEPVVEPEETLPEGQGVTIMQLTDTTCRWPCGDPATEAFRFCGKPGADMIVGQPYCAGHRHKASNPNARVMSDEERQRRALAYRRRMSTHHQEA
jgi:GcrA cell cycle regulator